MYSCSGGTRSKDSAQNRIVDLAQHAEDLLSGGFADLVVGIGRVGPSVVKRKGLLQERHVFRLANEGPDADEGEQSISPDFKQRPKYLVTCSPNSG